MTIASGNGTKGGTYLHTKRFTLAQVKDGEALPGAAGEAWVRIPTALAVFAAPILGGLFVVALPLIGAVAAVNGLVRKLAGGAQEAAADLASNLSPGPVAGQAHLTGKPGEEKGGEASAPELDAIAKEIDEKRQQ